MCRRRSFSPYLFILYNKSIQYDFVAIQIVQTAQHQHSLSEVCRRTVFVHSQYVVCRRVYYTTMATTTTTSARENGSKWLSRAHSIVCTTHSLPRHTNKRASFAVAVVAFVHAVLFDPCYCITTHAWDRRDSHAGRIIWLRSVLLTSYILSHCLVCDITLLFLDQIGACIEWTERQVGTMVKTMPQLIETKRRK